MRASASVTLPRGLWINGRHRRTLALRGVESDDETFLVESTGMLPAHRANALLARCVRALDKEGFDSGTIVRSLTAGDREALLLHLRWATFGDEFTGVFRCSQPSCAELLELNLRASDLLLPPYPDAAEWYVRPVAHDGISCDVRFRLPTAGDQEDSADLARTDPDAAARWVWERCVESVTSNGRALDAAALPQTAIDAIAVAMAELDPQAVIEFDVTCPACGGSYPAHFDPCDFLLRELDQRVERLLREIHTLAVCYHWSEAEILAMPPMRRGRYLELIAGVGALSA